MLFRPLAFAATAAAFLITPEMEQPKGHDESPVDGVKTLPFHPKAFPMPPMVQTVAVPCLQCKDEATLRFDFMIENGKSLTLNGFELYPSADPWHGDLIAPLVKDDGNGQEEMLGYSLAVTEEGVDEEQQMQVIGIDLRVVEVGGRFIDGIPALKIMLVKATTGEIIMVHAELKEVSETECNSAWCRAKHALGGLFKGKGCGRNKGKHGSKEHGGHGGKGAVEGHEGHHHHGHHGMKQHGGKGHGHAHNHHRWSKLLKNVVTHIFLPVLMGVAAGIGVAVFAMFVCAFFVRMSALVKGGRKERSWCSRRRSRRAARAAAVVDEEKTGLMEDHEAPPQYEEETDVAKI